LIDLSVIYTGISPEIGWLVISAFVWLVVNLLLILFRKILLRVGKSSVCSMTASSVDFMIFNLMLAILGESNYIPANLVSKLIGATTNFTMHKYWAFSVGGGNFKGQYGRYIMISAVSFLLNTGIIHICTAYLGLDPRLGWPIAGFLVWLCWNFVMTRLFVFKIPVFNDATKKND
ncbi:MAG: GtrA family protein, partial [Phycisphaerae bacterium]|nr:GtrA family protein [Phycisphaerae bacterium]